MIYTHSFLFELDVTLSEERAQENSSWWIAGL